MYKYMLNTRDLYSQAIKKHDRSDTTNNKLDKRITQNGKRKRNIKKLNNHKLIFFKNTGLMTVNPENYKNLKKMIKNT